MTQDFKFYGEEWMWVTANGDQVHIQDMETSHILNCLKYLKNKIDKLLDYGSWCDETSDLEEFEKTYNNMLLELRLRRKL